MSDIKNKHAVALLMPYYGVLPLYFNYYLRSLVNQELDVILFSDLQVGEHPENFRQVQMSFDEFKRLASQKMETDIRIDTPRRLCDFKPMYGKIFEDYIKDYDYWAFGDCDLVYGRLFSGLIEDAISRECDLFTLHEHYVAGPFCTIKNTAQMNMLWRQADDWQQVANNSSRQPVAFDELRGDWHQQLSSGQMTIEECRARGDSFTAIVRRTSGLKLIMKECIYEDALGKNVVRMKNGCLFRNDDEIFCFHYVCSKIRKYFKYVALDYSHVTDYIIDDTGFYPTPLYRQLRHPIGVLRKTKAAFNSLAKNGIQRIFR